MLYTSEKNPLVYSSEFLSSNTSVIYFLRRTTSNPEGLLAFARLREPSSLHHGVNPDDKAGFYWSCGEDKKVKFYAPKIPNTSGTNLCMGTTIAKGPELNLPIMHKSSILEGQYPDVAAITRKASSTVRNIYQGLLPVIYGFLTTPFNADVWGREEQQRCAGLAGPTNLAQFDPHNLAWIVPLEKRQMEELVSTNTKALSNS